MRSFFQGYNCHMPPLGSNVFLIILIQMNKFWTKELVLKFLMKHDNYFPTFFLFLIFPL